MPLTVVVKMRNLKKLLNSELLQLALFLSLLRSDPDYFISSNYNNINSDVEVFDDGQVWTRYEDRSDIYARGDFGSDLSPRLHPKSMDHILDRFQNEILEDLNNLGQYKSYRGDPVEISAYVLNTDLPLLNNSAGDDGSTHLPASSDSDSGISDTENNPLLADVNINDDFLSSDSETAIDPKDLELPKVDTGEEDSDGFVDPDFLADQLVEIDDQLITIDERLGEISDEFMQLDEELAIHINDDGVETDSSGPFNDWEMDLNRDLEDFWREDSTKLLLDEAAGGFQPSQIRDGVLPQHSSASSPSGLPYGTRDFDKYREMMKSSKAAKKTHGVGSPPYHASGDNGAVEQQQEFLFNKKFDPSPPSSIQRTDLDQPSLSDLFSGTNRQYSSDNHQLNNDLISTPSFPRKQPLSLASSPHSLESRSRNPSDLQQQQPPEKQQLTQRASSSSSLLQYANLQMNQSFYGENSDIIGQDVSFNNGNPESSCYNNGSSSASNNDTNFSEFHHPSVNTQTSLDFLNSSFHNAILRNDSESSFVDNNNHRRHLHHSTNVRSPAATSLSNGRTCSRVPSQGFDLEASSRLEHPNFLSYNSNDSSVGPAVSPHDGCPYPSGRSVYSPQGLPPYPQLNHSYAFPPQQQRLPPAFIKQEIKSDLSEGGGNINDSELKKISERGIRTSSTAVKNEKDAQSTCSSSSSSSSSTSLSTKTSTAKSCSTKYRHSKDEKRARELGVPFSAEDIISLPMDEYNDMISRHALTDEQLSLCRDIRRRGKNKVAAQNCRKRKIDQITELKTSIDLNRMIQSRLIEQRSHLIRIREEYAELVLDAQRQYWSKSKYDPELFELSFSDDGNSVAVVPKIRTSGDDLRNNTNYPH